MATKTFSAGGLQLHSTYTSTLQGGSVRTTKVVPGSGTAVFKISGLNSRAVVRSASISASLGAVYGNSPGVTTMNGKPISGTGTVSVPAGKVRNGATVAVAFTARVTGSPLPAASHPDVMYTYWYNVRITGLVLTVDYYVPSAPDPGPGGEDPDPESGQGQQSPFIGPGKTTIVPGRRSALIHVYPEAASDFSGNGPLILKPSQARITEEDNGDFSAELTHPMDREKRWMGLINRAILRMPAPARKSLSVKYRRSGSGMTQRADDLLMYKAQHSRGWAEMWSAPTSDDEGQDKERKLLLKVKNGRTLYLLGSENGKNNTLWYSMSTDRGVAGWVLSTEAAAQAGATARVQDVNEEQARDQLFRIYDVTEDSRELAVTVRARHIFYDLLKVIYMGQEKMTGVPAAQALQALFSYADHPTPFRISTDCTGTVTGDFRGKNLVAALMDPEEGMLAQLNAHIVRDNYDIYVIQDPAMDRGVRVQHQRNLRGAKARRSSDGMINRIIARIDGETTVVDDPNRPAGAEILSGFRTYEKDKGTAREQALREFEAGASAQDFTLDVDFLLLAETPRFSQYNGLQKLYLGDLCDVTLPWALYQAAVSAYTWNCITLVYDSTTVGATAVKEMLGAISSYQIRGVGASKLLGQIVSDQIGDLEIRTRHLAAASITSEKIEAGSVTAQKISANAVTAEKISAGAVTTDKLDAGAVTADKLAAGSVTAEKLTAAAIDAIYAHLATADIDWADIATLNAVVADIADAQINVADIDWGQVKDLISKRAIITQGEAGELYIARLAVTEANLLSLTVGEILVKGEDGGFYALTVDEEGNVSAEKKQVDNEDIQDGSIFGDQKLIEGSITARSLNAQEIFGENAIIRQLIAETLDVDALFAREAVINRLNAIDITGNESLRIYVQTQEEMSAYLRVTEDGLEIGRVGDTARFRADNRTMEVTNVKTERLGITQAMGVDEEWAWIATKSGLGLKYVG